MGDEELAKDLGLVSAMTIGIGTMIGAGIFVLPGVAAQEAGPVVVVSFIVGGVIAMVNALSISELGTAMPKAGGGYYYVNRALGPMFGSIAGLGDWMGLAFASAFYSIGFGQYLTTLAPIPGFLFLNDIQIGALIAGAIFVAVNYIGAKETGGIQTIIVFTLLAILSVFAIVGWFSFDYATIVGSGGWAPKPEGYGAILPATALVFVSFLGYAKIATVAEEMKNPGRNLPIAIIGSVGIVTVIYGILVTIMLGIVPWPELDLEAPVANAARVAFPGGLAGIAATTMTLGALLATASSANASILSSARINFAMGRDKIVTNWLNAIHPNYATPYRSIAVTGGMILVLIAFLGRDLEILAKAASVLHLMVYALMNVALIVFRETDPEGYDPDFTVPLYPITPIVGAILSLALIGFMNPNEIALSALFVVVAVGWYFLYARGETDHQGHLGQYILDRSEEMPEAAVSAASTVQPDSSTDYRVMVPLSNPRTERNLIELGSLLAKAKGGTVVATHIVQVPDQTPLYGSSDHVDRIDAESQKLLDAAREDAETFGADVETRTILSHRSFEEVFDAARTDEADLVVMGWNPDSPLAAGRVESPLDELTSDLPCDFLVMKDRGFDLSDVLVPTAGGYSSDLSGEVARNLADRGSDVSLLHVVDNPTEQEAGETFLNEWAADHDLDDATQIVDDSGDIEGAIAHHAEDHSMVIIGATRKGLLSRLVRGSLAFQVLNDVDSSVLLAERPHQRSLVDRLFGR
jgi:amino acid transporter/nucleotide-binding universal stress UspA family protein